MWWKTIVSFDQFNTNRLPKIIGELDFRMGMGEIQKVSKEKLEGKIQIPVGLDILVITPYDTREKFENLDPFEN
ncbi:MAG: hypothetical protein WC356_00895 [Candidatus Micrarchaeia archaeon]|jgi:hypothetical protein